MVHVHCKPFPYKHERNRIHSFILQYQAMINHKIRFFPTFRRGNVVNNWSMQSWTLIFFELITLHLGQLKIILQLYLKKSFKDLIQQRFVKLFLYIQMYKLYYKMTNTAQAHKMPIQSTIATYPLEKRWHIWIILHWKRSGPKKCVWRKVRNSKTQLPATGASSKISLG